MSDALATRCSALYIGLSGRERCELDEFHEGDHRSASYSWSRRLEPARSSLSIVGEAPAGRLRS